MSDAMECPSYFPDSRVPHGGCPECGRYFRLTTSGKIWRHMDRYVDPQQRCAGSGRMPLRIEMRNP